MRGRREICGREEQVRQLSQSARMWSGVLGKDIISGRSVRVCLKNSLIRNFGVFCAISASSTLDLALLSLRVSSLNWRKIHSNLRIFLFETHSKAISKGDCLRSTFNEPGMCVKQNTDKFEQVNISRTTLHKAWQEKQRCGCNQKSTIKAHIWTAGTTAIRIWACFFVVSERKLSHMEGPHMEIHVWQIRIWKIPNSNNQRKKYRKKQTSINLSW